MTTPDSMAIDDIIAAIDRPDKDTFYLFLAECLSILTTDAETGVGCVLTNQKNRIIATGYNGHPPKMDWSKLPNKRPHKYRWMAHAEKNAVKNAVVIPEDAIAYLSHPPCFECLTQNLWPNVTEVHFLSDDGRNIYYAEDEPLFEQFFQDENVNIKYIKHSTPNFNFVSKIIERLINRGFFNKEILHTLKEGV